MLALGDLGKRAWAQKLETHGDLKKEDKGKLILIVDPFISIKYFLFKIFECLTRRWFTPSNSQFIRETGNLLMSAVLLLVPFLPSPCLSWHAPCGTEVYQFPNTDNFINNFFNHRKGLGGKDCDEGYYVYSSDPHDYSVIIKLISG